MLRKRFQSIPGRIIKPVPLFLYQPLMRKMSSHIADKHPHLFSRLGSHTDKRFLINPTNMPFVILLRPDPNALSMMAYRNKNDVEYDASITGSFVNLLRLMDSELDGDSLFFNRDLKVDGDTEAVVRLRNALDDIEGSVASDLADMFGRPGTWALSTLRKVGA